MASSYMAHDRPAPPEEVISLQESVGEVNPLILGCDANARHTLWGSTETNERGESLFEFIISTKLSICNTGNTPTFIFPSTSDYEGWEEVLDITLVTEGDLKVEGWRVSDDVSLSDHRWILFETNLQVDDPPPFRNPKRTNWKRFVDIFRNKIKNHDASEVSTRDELDSQVGRLENTMRMAFKRSCPLRYGKKALPPW